MIWIFRFFDFLSVVFPIKIFYFLSNLIGVLTYCLGLNQKRKGIVIENLRQAGIKSSGFSSFIGFTRYIGEFMAMPKLNKRNLDRWMELIGIDRLKTEYNKGKGVIVLTGHLGNWELGATMLSILGHSTNAVSIHYMNKAVANFYERRRKKKGVRVIYIEEVKKMLKVLSKGEILAIVGDKVFSGEGIEVKFFGKTTKFPPGAFRLAAATQASIIPAFAVHDEKGKIKVYFEKPIYVNTKKEVMTGLIQYISILERYIRQYPAEWCAFEPIWTNHSKD